MNEAFIMKLIQAKRLEKEAFKELLPDEVTKHTDVIEEELKEMAKELLGEGLKSGFDMYMKAKASASCEYSTEKENTENDTKENDNRENYNKETEKDSANYDKDSKNDKTIRRNVARSKKVNTVRSISID